MGDLNWMNSKRPDLETLVGLHLPQVGVVEKFVLLQLVFYIGQRKLSAPDGHVKLRKNPGKRSDVVLMAVSENDASHMLAVFFQVRDIGNDDVHPEQLRLREHQS